MLQGSPRGVWKEKCLGSSLSQLDSSIFRRRKRGGTGSSGALPRGLNRCSSVDSPGAGAVERVTGAALGGHVLQRRGAADFRGGLEKNVNGLIINFILITNSTKNKGILYMFVSDKTLLKFVTLVSF